MSSPANYQRPGLVWIISFFFFIKTVLALLSLVLIPLMLFGVIPMNDTQRRIIDSLTSMPDFVGFLSILIKLCQLGGAIFLFLLRRPALNWFWASFLVTLLAWGYLISVEGWPAAIGSEGHLRLVFFGLLLNVAILCYVRHLFVSKVLH